MHFLFSLYNKINQSFFMKYRDIALEYALVQSREKTPFSLFCDREIGFDASMTPESRAYGLSKVSQMEIPEAMKPIVSLEHSLIDVLSRMENKGVAFDKKKMQDIGTRIDRDVESLEREIYALAGETFNINSPKQIQVLLFDKMGIKPLKKNKTGFSVDNEVLEKIALTHDIARLILEYRTLAKLRSTYVDWLLHSVNPVDGRIHTTYDSLGAATGRMSSNDPNLQNIPTGDGYAREIKSCFIPSSWNIFLVADYSQIELRVLAFLSQDKNLLDTFARGEDIHSRTAKFLFPEKKEITPHERRIAKTVNFGVIYGITGFGLSKTLGSNPWEAENYIKAFYELYPWVQKYYDTILDDARKNGYTETYFGRRRIIRGINDANKTIRSISEREAINMPIQWTAADMIKYAMVDIDTRIREKNLRGSMILQVHDELVFDIPKEEKEEFEWLVHDLMEWILVQYEISKKNEPSHIYRDIPPILVDISFGANWAEAK